MIKVILLKKYTMIRGGALQNLDNTLSLTMTGEQLFWLMLFNMSSVLLLKLALIGVAALTIHMGYKMLVQGIKGEFKFQGEMKGVKADLASASPGTFFVLLGVIVLIAAISVKYSMPIKQSANATKPSTSLNKEVSNEQIPKTDPFATIND